MNIEKKLEEYRLLKIKLAEVKQAEMDLRVELCEELGKGLEAGTHNFTEYTGMKVKIVSKLNYLVDAKVLEGLDLDTYEAECLRFKPELNLKQYKMTDTDTLDEAVTIKTGAPSLTVDLV